MTSAVCRWQVIHADEDSWISQRACQFGDGLFETVATRAGRPCLWDRHLARLALGCERLGLAEPDYDELTASLGAAVAGHSSLGIKLFWTAGPSRRGYARPAGSRPTGALQRFAWAVPDTMTRMQITVCRHRLSENPALCGIKHLNRLDQVLGRRDWDDPDVAEGVMLGQDGRVVCGTRSNIVIEQKGELMTPELTSAGVAGVVRACLIEEGLDADHPVIEQRLTLEDVWQADAVYVTNALMGVARVSKIDDVEYDLSRPISPLLQRVHARAIGLDLE
jgi:4-amino-4-deoxychorismate lyase